MTEACCDVGALLSGDTPLMPPEIDQVGPQVWRQRGVVRELIGALDGNSMALVKDLLRCMLDKGSIAFHHHTVEHQIVPLAVTPEKGLGEAVNLCEERKRKRRLGQGTSHGQERQFGVLREKHERAPSLLHHHMEGRVRNQIDSADVWVLSMVADGYMSADRLEIMGDIVRREARRRAKAIGGRTGQCTALGRQRIAIDDVLLAKAAEQQRKLDAEVARLAAVRVTLVSALQGMSSAALLDQIRVFKLIDKVAT